MSLNINKAIRYNKRRKYDAQSTRIIQSLLRTNISGVFDEQTVRSAYDWQGSPSRMATLAQDGMVGPNSLGVLIAEARSANKHKEASLLAPYEHNLPSGQIDPHLNPVRNFVHSTISHPKFKPRIGNDGVGGWVMKGCFEVKIQFDLKMPDPDRFEYRQLIRGIAAITEGAYLGANNTNWQALSPEQSANYAFQNEGGLPTSFKEDSQMVNGKKERFGYRSSGAVYKPNGREGLIDRYWPEQKKGHQYHCRDTFGLECSLPSVVGTKVRMELDFVGYVIDKLLAQIVMRRNWSYKKTEILQW